MREKIRKVKKGFVIEAEVYSDGVFYEKLIKKVELIIMQIEQEINNGLTEYHLKFEDNVHGFEIKVYKETNNEDVIEEIFGVNESDKIYKIPYGGDKNEK